MQGSWLPALSITAWTDEVQTFALCAKDTYIKGRYSDCIQTPLSSWACCWRRWVCAVPIHLGIFRESFCYQSLLFVQTPISWLSRKSFICDKPDVMWAEIQETNYSWGQQDWRKLLSSTFDSWDWIPACTGRGVRLTPLSTSWHQWWGFLLCTLSAFMRPVGSYCLQDFHLCQMWQTLPNKLKKM